MSKPQRLSDASGSAKGGCVQPLGKIERLPKWLLCVPLVAQWFWLGLRYRSLTLPSCVNPAIKTGGMAGETKFDTLSLIASEHTDWVAPTSPVPPGADPETARVLAGLSFPVIAKPDIGWCGYGVRRIDDAAQLAAYAAEFPIGATYLLQAFVPGPLEAGLFYMRRPCEIHGRLIGIAVRHQPQVTGDGISSVAELAAADARLLRTNLPRDTAARVPGAGEVVLLSTVASLRVGGRYENAIALHTPALEARVDAIARSVGGFNFGRLDARFTSTAALQAGLFQIIEINGAGSEAIQFWDPGIGLLAAYFGVFRKQTMLFALGAAYRRLGHKSTGVMELSRAWLAQQRLIGRYPASN